MNVRTVATLSLVILWGCDIDFTEPPQRRSSSQVSLHLDFIASAPSGTLRMEGMVIPGTILDGEESGVGGIDSDTLEIRDDLLVPRSDLPPWSREPPYAAEWSLGSDTTGVIRIARYPTFEGIEESPAPVTIPFVRQAAADTLDLGDDGTATLRLLRASGATHAPASSRLWVSLYEEGSTEPFHQAVERGPVPETVTVRRSSIPDSVSSLVRIAVLIGERYEVKSAEGHYELNISVASILRWHLRAPEASRALKDAS